MVMQHKQITLPHLHPGQLEAARSTARFRLLACGRRWGKTKLCAHEAMRAMLEGKRVWHVAPTYAIGLIAFRDMVMMGRQIPGVNIQMGAKTLSFGAQGSIAVKSADYPNNLRGEGIDLLILDEAAFMPEETWVTILRPSLMDKRGRALLASSPNGKNWFYNAYKSDLFESWQWPSWTSPFLAPGEIETMRATYPKAQFAQEVAADFVDFQGRVFPAPEVLPAIPSRGTAKGACVFGVAVGRSPDATAVAIAPTEEERVWCVQRTHRDYARQLAWLENLVREWEPALVVLNSGGAETPIARMLLHKSKWMVAAPGGAAAKAVQIDALINGMEVDKYALPDNEKVLNQFETYACHRKPSGEYTFNAPPGMPEDAVAATLLVYWAQQMVGQSVRAYRI